MPLREELRGIGQRIVDFHDRGGEPPYLLYVYPPAEEWSVRSELKELQHRGLIHRKQYDVVPPKVEYSLTDLGRGLQPVLESVVEWGLTGAHEEILGMNVNPPTSAVKANTPA